MSAVEGRAAPAQGLFSPRTVLLLVLVGVFSFTALLVLSAYAPDGQGKTDPGAHAMSRSAVGFAGFVDLLHELGRTAVVARGPVDRRAPSIMVLTIDHGDPKTALPDLPTTRGYAWPILAVLPKWEALPVLLPAGWVRKGPLRKVDADTWIGSGDKSIALGHLPGVASHRLVWLGEGGGELRTGPIDQMQVFTAMAGWQPVVVEEGGGIVLARAKNSNFYALSDPDLMNTQGLKQIANAQAGLAMLATVTGGRPVPVFFDVTLNGLGRSRSLIKLAVEPPFLAATLSAFCAALLVGWAAFNRFGATRRQGRVFALGKRALADNQAGLIRMAKREHRLGGRYVQAIRGLVAKAVGAPRDLEEPALEAFLDRLGANRGAEDTLSGLAESAAKAKTGAEIAAVAQRLYRWRLATTGERAP